LQRGQRGFIAIFEAFVVGEGFAQEVFDLAIEAAQLVVGPFLQGVQDGGVYAKKEGFSLGHGYESLVEREGGNPRISTNLHEAGARIRKSRGSPPMPLVFSCHG
jgi:hypothetical protein